MHCCRTVISVSSLSDWLDRSYSLWRYGLKSCLVWFIIILLAAFCTVLSVLNMILCIFNTETPSSSSGLSAPPVHSLAKAWVVWYLMPPRRTLWNSDSDTCSRHYGSFHVRRIRAAATSESLGLFQRRIGYLRDMGVIILLLIRLQSTHSASSAAFLYLHTGVLISIQWVLQVLHGVLVAAHSQFVCHMRWRQRYYDLSPR